MSPKQLTAKNIDRSNNDGIKRHRATVPRPPRLMVSSKAKECQFPRLVRNWEWRGSRGIFSWPHHHPGLPVMFPTHSRHNPDAFPTRSMDISVANSTQSTVDSTGEELIGNGPAKFNWPAINERRAGKRELIRMAKKRYAVGHGTRSADTRGPAPPPQLASPSPPHVLHSAHVQIEWRRHNESPDAPNDSHPPKATDVAAHLERICSIHTKWQALF
ncbi:hypothetical protein B0H13DRAFT_1861847 [Mycena leptocephala]|nr:hypothetical protein B0H13DRAFT_1861847 [Mycena leptocephala]